MSQQVTNGALLMCSFGTGPSNMIVTPENRVMVGGQPAATIMDYIPMKNILPFIMCTAPTNPMVIAAQGVPVPCMPAVTAPWVIGSPTVLLSKKIGLNNTSKCFCTWAGVIQIQMAGQFTVNIP